MRKGFANYGEVDIQEALYFFIEKNNVLHHGILMLSY
jgi:hypothetical protein